MISCISCVYLHDDEMTCEAFPEGIPISILSGDFDHRKPHPGDNDKQYIPIEGQNVKNTDGLQAI